MNDPRAARDQGPRTITWMDDRRLEIDGVRFVTDVATGSVSLVDTSGRPDPVVELPVVEETSPGWGLGSGAGAQVCVEAEVVNRDLATTPSYEQPVPAASHLGDDVRRTCGHHHESTARSVSGRLWWNALRSREWPSARAAASTTTPKRANDACTTARTALVAELDMFLAIEACTDFYGYLT